MPSDRKLLGWRIAGRMQFNQWSRLRQMSKIRVGPYVDYETIWHAARSLRCNSMGDVRHVNGKPYAGGVTWQIVA